MRITAVLCAAFILLFAVSVAFINPLLEQQKPRVERWLEQVLAQPVQLSGVSIHWDVLSPTLNFTDVVILNDANTRALFKIARMKVNLDIKNSLLKRQFILETLFISGADLTLHQDAEHRWSIGGIENTEGGEPIELKEWLLSERKVLLENISLKAHFANGQIFTASAKQLNFLADKGIVQMEGGALRFNLAGVFRDVITLDTTTATFDLKKQEAKIQTRNADLDVTGTLNLYPDSVIDLRADFELLRGVNKSLYLPIAILKPSLVSWLDTAIVQAKQGRGKLILRGNLKDFPFDEQQKNGEFTIDANITGVTLDYEKGWPALQDLTARLLFSGRRMEITANTGKILNTPIKQAKAVIADLDADIPVLKITSGDILTDSAEVLAFIEHSPLKETLGPDLENMTLTGPLHLNLDLTIPLDETQSNKVSGQLFLTDNQVNGRITQVKGQIDFTEDSLSAKNLTASFLGQPLQATLRQAPGSHTVEAVVQYGKNIRAKILYQTHKLTIQLSGPIASGYITSPMRTNAPWQAKLQHLYLTDELQGVSALKLSDIPAVELFVSDFQYNKKQLGQLTLKLQPSPKGLEIHTLVLHASSFTLTANGLWGAKSTRITGHAVSNNLTDTLKRWNIPAMITGQSTNLAFNLVWPGTSYMPVFDRIEGTMNIQIKNGQIMDIGSNAAAQMGLGRILTLLSLQTLQRRLKLDFSDLGHTGFSFDSVRGQFKLSKGNARTDDAILVGPVAHVNIKGRIGITDKDYNMTLLITPHLTASLPVLATIFGGPFIGAAVWTADKVLGSRLVGEITARRYQLRGSWASPEISLLGTVAVPAGTK